MALHGLAAACSLAVVGGCQSDTRFPLMTNKLLDVMDEMGVFAIIVGLGRRRRTMGYYPKA